MSVHLQNQVSRYSSRDNQRQGEKITEEALLRQYLELLAHDFITPLTNIKVNLYLLAKKVQQGNAVTYLQSLEQETEHLKILFDELLAMLRLDLQVNPLEDTLGNLEEMLSNLLKSMEIRAKQQRVCLRLEISKSPLPKLHFDERKLRCAISNILDNALTHNRADSCVTVTVKCCEKHLIICIQDQGIGIPADKLPYIFHRFYRGDTARSAKTGNLGLGLSISQSIVHEHGGHIEVETTEGLGSSFSIFLPLSRVQEAAQS